MAISFSKVLYFLGLRNKADSRRQTKGDNNTAISIYDCENVYLDDEGAFNSREGFFEAMQSGNITAAFAIESTQYGYIVDNGELKKVTSTVNASDGTVIKTNLMTTDLGPVSTKPVEWLEVGTQVFMSTGFIINNNKLIPWSVPIPNQPSIAVTSGHLPAGQYQLTMTQLMPDGRESGSCEVIALNLQENSGLILQGTDNNIVYMTALNGSVFYEVGMGIQLINSIADLTNRSINKALLLANPLPPDISKIAFYDGALHCAVYDHVNNQSAVFWSNKQQMLPHIFNYFEDVINGITGEIRMLYGTEDGLLIGTDREILLYDVGIKKLAGYGVTSGKPLKKDRDGKAYFQSLRGVCVPHPFTNVTGDKFIQSLGGNSSTAIIETEGSQHFVTITDGTGLPEDTTDF